MYLGTHWRLPYAGMAVSWPGCICLFFLAAGAASKTEHFVPRRLIMAVAFAGLHRLRLRSMSKRVTSVGADPNLSQWLSFRSAATGHFELNWRGDTGGR